MAIALRTSTGSAPVDEMLRRLIGALEHALPGRARSYYLCGSYSDGTASDLGTSPGASDLDVLVVVRGSLAAHERAVFDEVVGALRASSPVLLDAHPCAEDDLRSRPARAPADQAAFNVALLRGGSVPVFGDDLAAELPEVPVARFLLDALESGVYHLGIPRQRENLPAYPLVVPLVPPLGYPDPGGEFYGYDGSTVGDGTHRGTRLLVAITGWIATAILARETGRCATRKSECARLCRELLPADPRAQLAAAIYETCKRDWRYALPTEPGGRACLRGWCERALALENDHLAFCRSYLLERLQGGDAHERRQAARLLQSVVYHDEAMASALRALASGSDENAGAAARRALVVWDGLSGGPSAPARGTG